MPVYTTACPRNCYSTCSMLVTVEDNRLVRIEAHPSNLATAQGVCLKGLSYVERQTSPNRLLTPLKQVRAGRKRQEFVPIAWDQALDEIAENLRSVKNNYGPQAVMYYAASGTKGWLNRIGARFWRLFGGYTGIFGDLCWPAGLEATRLTLGANKHNAPWDIANARLIVMWGKNPAETNIQQMPFIEQAVRQGARLVVIDPRRSTTAERASLHIQPHPGTDGALALGIGHLLVKNNWVEREFIAQNVLGFEAFTRLVANYTPARTAAICGIPQEQVETLAHMIGTIKPLTINAGYGMQRYTNGGQSMRAIIALCAITGNIGKPGAGWVYANLQSHIFDHTQDPIDSYPPAEPDGVARISVSTARLGHDMLAQQNPPLKFLWVERGNPVPQNPDTHSTLRAIRSLDFRIVVEETLTDTAREADIILPAKTLFEQTDVINAYWHDYIQLKQKILKPPSGVRPESEVYWQLGLRLGFSPEAMENAGIPRPGETEHMLQQMLEQLNQQYGSLLTLDQLAQSPMLSPAHQEIAFSDLVFSTPSGKIELYSEEAARRWKVDPLPVWNPPVETSSIGSHPDFPLQMLTPNTKNAIHSQFHRLEMIKEQSPGPRLAIHPTDAAPRGLQTNDQARIFNARGEIFLPVFLDDGLRPGCVSCPNGYWLDQGAAVNLLSAARETDMGFGAAFHDNLVQVEKCLTRS